MSAYLVHPSISFFLFFCEKQYTLFSCHLYQHEQENVRLLFHPPNSTLLKKSSLNFSSFGLWIRVRLSIQLYLCAMYPNSYGQIGQLLDKFLKTYMDNYCLKTICVHVVNAIFAKIPLSNELELGSSPGQNMSCVQLTSGGGWHSRILYLDKKLSESIKMIFYLFEMINYFTLSLAAFANAQSC